MQDFTITEEEHRKLMEAYDSAQKTPVIALSVAQGLSGNDFSSLVWKRVRSMMEDLGKKYGYQPESAKIQRDSTSFKAVPISGK